jgi:hypothetical protein
MSQVNHNEKTARIEELELAKETIQDLSEAEAQNVQGGMMPDTRRCHSSLNTCVTKNVGC